MPLANAPAILNLIDGSIGIDLAFHIVRSSWGWFVVSICLLASMLLKLLAAPSKCVLLSTSRKVWKDMKDWVLSQDGDRWSVKFDVRDLGGHLDYFSWLVFNCSC